MTPIANGIGRGATRILAAAALLALVSAAPAGATVIFSDDFDANPLAFDTAPSGWSQLSGTVDIVGPTLFGELCAGGPSPSRCIDLDGSTLDAANLQTSVAIPEAGTYLLSFWLQANDRGAGLDLMTVSFGSYSQLFSLTSLGNDADSWAQFSGLATFGSAGSYLLSFDHQGADNIGILLDNVQVESVPEPGTLLLLGAGLSSLALRRRRSS